MTTRKYFEICSWLAALIKGTKWEGHLFAVGGCCRDEILERDIKDLDLAVDIPGGGIDFAKWLHRKRLTVGYPVFFTKFGTAKLSLKKWPDEEIEIVQTRAEKYTKKTSRCPEVVAGTIEEDCFRRDFTVNTLYRDISGGKILDLTGRGISDIKRGLIRTPMDPDVTFDDDPVRILRCIRFATRFGWEIDEKTFEALNRNINRLSIVSKERNRGELGKMVAGNAPVKALEMLRETGALKYMLPLLGEMTGNCGVPRKRSGKKKLKKEEKSGTAGDNSVGAVPASQSYKLTDEELYGIWSRAMNALEHIPNHDLPLRLAALLAENGKLRTRVKNRKGVVSYPNYEMLGANMARRALRSLKFEDDELAEMAFLIRNQNLMASWGKFAELMTDRDLRKLQMMAHTPESFEKLMQLVDARAGSSTPIPLTQRVRIRSAEMQAEGTDLFNRTVPAAEIETYLSNPPRRRQNT